ncbi:MAG: PH domain-containing protein [Ruminococcus flavefaciens]|nr:PH domain-containing protein [Ruminococcus flavefaciens]
MSTNCAICGRKLGMLTAKAVTKDHYAICSTELASFAPDFKASDFKIDYGVAKWVSNHTLQEFIDLYNSGQRLVDSTEPPVKVSLDEIKRQMDEAGVSDLFGTSKEVKYLPSILEENEIIKYATSGSIDANTALVICTNLRVLVIDRGMIYGTRSTEIPLDMVNGVSYSQGMVLGKIDIVNGSEHVLIDNVDKRTAPIMADVIKHESQSYKANLYNQNNNSPSSALDPADEIKKYKELLDMGAITEEEFNAKKKQLLDL